jgi:hypothetical protein
MHEGSIHSHRDFKQEFPEILKDFPERKDSPEESPHSGGIPFRCFEKAEETHA